jgi:hypothetical protein
MSFIRADDEDDRDWEEISSWAEGIAQVLQNKPSQSQP